MLNILRVNHTVILTIWQSFDGWDKSLFKLLNGQLTNAFFDKITPWWREQNTWYPLYISLVIYVALKLKRNAWIWILAFIITITLSDIISSHILKEWIGRVRPCRDASLVGYCRLLIGRCPESGSFTSSHASNHFAMGVFIYYTLKRFFGNWGLVFVIWAATIAYAQVYVGVHYPFDVIGGGILGSIIGKSISILYSKYGMNRLNRKI